MSKFLQILLGLSIVLFTTSCFGKVTNPTDPRFDPDKFRFEDYYNPITGSSLPKVFRKLFPPGTSKAFVDRVLVDAGGAVGVEETNFKNVWTYRQPRKWYHFKGPPSHIFSFDENNQLVNIRHYRVLILYPQNPDYKEQTK